MNPPYVGQVIGIPQCCDVPTPFQIFLGDAKSMYMRVINGGYAADPVDLTSADEIVVNLPNADGTITQLKKTTGGVVVDTALLGKFHAVISSVASALLNVGELQDVDVTFTIGTLVFTVTYQQALSVYQVA